MSSQEFHNVFVTFVCDVCYLESINNGVYHTDKICLPKGWSNSGTDIFCTRCTNMVIEEDEDEETKDSGSEIAVRPPDLERAVGNEPS